VPTRNPAGSLAWVASQARWTEREENTLAELGTIDKWCGHAAV
jgi:hypothetical protein